MIWINGEACPRENAKISVFDHGLLYGDGIFEGIRIYNGKAFRLDEHIQRLFDSASAIMLDIGQTKESMVDDISRMVEEDGRGEGYIRLIVTRGVGPLGIDPAECQTPNVVVIIDDITLYPAACYHEGIPIVTAGTRRNRVGSLDPRIKSLNYLNNVLAKLEARQAGCREALMLTEEGFVLECTGDNIVAVHDSQLVTPHSALGSLSGITLNTTLELADKAGLETDRRDMTRYDLYTAGEVFLTGTACEIMPVTKIDGRLIGDGTPGPVTRRLIADFARYVREGS